jgi:adenosylhomocysteine nucleosidase
MQKVPLAVISALDDEIRIIRSRMSVDARIHIRPGLVTKGTYLQRPIMLVRSGVGRDAMRTTMTHLFSNHRPEVVIHTGYCGAASPALAPGDLVIAEGIVDSSNQKRVPCDEALVAKAKKILRDKSMRGSAGDLVTVEQVASSPHEKAYLATQHSSIGVDMESSELAAACAESNIPFVVVRAVLDPLDYHIPNLADAIDEDGSTDGLALAEHLVKKPADFLKLPRLQYLASQARTSITAFIDAWLEEDEA